MLKKVYLTMNPSSIGKSVELIIEEMFAPVRCSHRAFVVATLEMINLIRIFLHTRILYNTIVTDKPSLPVTAKSTRRDRK